MIPSIGDRGLREDRVLLRDPDAVADREVEQVAEQRGGPDLVELEAEVAVEDAADVLAEVGDRGVRVGDADAVQDARDGVRVAQRHRDDERDERLLLRAREPADEAEVEERDPVAGEDEDVPGVRIAVEEPVLEELPERGLDDVLRDLLEVVARPRRVTSRDLRPLDVVEREDGRRRRAPSWTRGMTRKSRPAAASRIARAFRASFAKSSSSWMVRSNSSMTSVGV